MSFCSYTARGYLQDHLQMLTFINIFPHSILIVSAYSRWRQLPTSNSCLFEISFWEREHHGANLEQSSRGKAVRVKEHFSSHFAAFIHVIGDTSANILFPREGVTQLLQLARVKRIESKLWMLRQNSETKIKRKRKGEEMQKFKRSQFKRNTKVSMLRKRTKKFFRIKKTNLGDLYSDCFKMRKFSTVRGGNRDKGRDIMGNKMRPQRFQAV